MNYEIAKQAETAARITGMKAFVVQGYFDGTTTDYGVQFENDRFDMLFMSVDMKKVVDYISRNSSQYH